MANINVTLNSASLQVLDLTTNAFRVNSSIGTITLLATASFYDAYFQAAAGAGSVVSLPAATVWFVYVKNLHLTQSLTVQLTVAGGAQISAANSPILTPGGVFMYANPGEASGGITGVTLIGSGANTSAEVLLAA
jgi:hypothetical protein